MRLISKTTSEFINDLLPMQNSSGSTEIATYQELPDLSVGEFIGATVKTLIGWSMIITIIAIVVTGIFFLTAQGKDEDISKAKDVMIYALIGLVIMASAYAVVVGLIQFNFLEAA